MGIASLRRGIAFQTEVKKSTGSQPSALRNWLPVAPLATRRL